VRITTALIAVLMCTTSVFAQVVNRSTQDRDRDPCQGGGISVEVEPVGGRPGLDQLIAMSELVIVGTVNNVLPAFNPSPNDKRTVETDSLVAIDQILYGKLPTGVRTILLFQLGGSTATCSMVVPADPLVKNGERYVLFLRVDPRTQVPNASGAPRYFAAGYWSGKAQIVNGRIQFRPEASAGLHRHDSSDVNVFLETVQERIDKVLPKQR
jgi:hypothetical protein